MSTAVQITLIICVTIIISQVISTFGKKEEKLNQIVEIKSPTCPRPPRTGSGIK
jgi:hypothetical protein